MFSHELDRRLQPLSTRRRGILLGSILTTAVVAAMISPRTLPFLYALVVASFLAAAAGRGALKTALPLRGPVSWYLAAFLGYALISACWALEPDLTFALTSLAVLVAAGTLALIQLFAEETHPNLIHMGEGVWIGLLVGISYLFIELASGQSIKIWVYNALSLRPGDLPHADYFTWSGGKIIAILREDLTRNMAPVSLFLWPGVMSALGTLRRRWGILVGAVAVSLAGVVIMLSWHETSKLAFVAGLLTFGAAHVVTRFTGRVVAAGWVIACLAILPSALIAHRLDLHNASWLEGTARHRIIIWNYTAEQVLKAPWLGIGARSTYVLGPRLEKKKNVTHTDEAFIRTLSVHSHSVYLQTWFELGLIGATLLTLVGLSILQAIRALARPLQSYAYATFVSAAVMAASSYGMWQIWFVAMFGATAALFGLGARLLTQRYASEETVSSRVLQGDAAARA